MITESGKATTNAVITKVNHEYNTLTISPGAFDNYSTSALLTQLPYTPDFSIKRGQDGTEAFKVIGELGNVFAVGRIGIGTFNPLYKLHLYGLSDAVIMTETTSASGKPGFNIKTPSRAWSIYEDGSDGNKLKVFTGGTGDILTIWPDGKMVAKNVESDKLKVKTSSGITLIDRITGQPVCVYSENNVLQSLAGECPN